jgi:hypothetical protein
MIRFRYLPLCLIFFCAVPTARARLWGDWGGWEDEWRREDYEEEAGASFALYLNPEDGIYGMSFGEGTWLKGAPVFGDYFLAAFKNDIEDAVYSGVGLTIRLMPRWKLAPFLGGGGSYNYSLSDNDEDDDLLQDEDPDELPDRGESYWGGHAEGGFRLWTEGKLQLFELMFRQTWSSLDGERDYWLVGISTGAGI